MRVSTLAAGIALAGCLLTSLDARGQDVSRDELSAIRAKLERQEAELRSLRTQLEAQHPQPLPPIARSMPVARYANASTAALESPESVDKRIKAIEKQLAKDADAAKKKKKEDATKPVVKPRGRLHADVSWFDQSDTNEATVGDIQDGAYFRRARLGMDAKAFEVTEYRLDFEMGAGGGRPSIFDAYGRVTELPYAGNVQIGHFREPFSLEAQTSSNWLTFIERASNTVFDPSRNFGVMAFDHSEDYGFTWAGGVFREGSDLFGDDIGDSGERAATGRLTWLPYYDEPSDGRYFLHFGGAYSYCDPDHLNPGGVEIPIVGYSGRPPVNTREDGVGGVPAFVSTGNISDANHLQLAGAEASLVWGSFNIQSEYVGSFVDRSGAADADFDSAYIFCSYFLTGEHRVYNRGLGTYDKQEVYEPFFRVWTDRGTCTGSGAWEVALRWDYLNLNSGTIQGGYLDNVTFGVNWYLNAYVRLMFNYIYTDLHDPVDGRSDANTFLTRMSVFF